jgi:subtilisin-like proprotein convertase family protein
MSRICILLLLASMPLVTRAELVATWSGAQKIPEGSGVSHQFTLSSPKHAITDIAVTLNIAGGYNGDLYAYLSHGDGFAVLLNRVGRTSANPDGYGTPGFAVTLVGNAAADIHRYESLNPAYNVAGQLTNTWGSDGRDVLPDASLDTTARTATLDEFRGMDPNGAWTLFLLDASAGGEATLTGWTVDVSTSSESWYGGGTNVVRLNDAIGTAGSFPGWDLRSIDGSLILNATPSRPFTIKLVTLSGAAAGPVANFNPAYHYGWRIVTPTAGLTGFNAGAFTVDTSGVANPFTGSFNMAAYGNSLYLYYQPACQLTTLGHEVQGDGKMHMYFTNTSGLKSMQGVVATNCTILGTAYNIADEILGTSLVVVTNSRTELPPGTTRLELAATKATSGDAWVNAMVKNYCDIAKQFDPVFTRLEVTSGNWVQKGFTGLLAAEHYLQVINATPGLQWLEVNLNGHIFRLNSLAAGQSVAADLASAMNEGDANVVVLTGYGDIGASALVLITDQSAGDLVQLSEVAELALARSSNRVVISWPEALAGWQLQASETLESGWQDVATTPMIAEGYQTVSLAKGNHPQFFRLRKASAAAVSTPAATTRAKAMGRTFTTMDALPPTKRTYDRLAW